jgi:hypothetical protein
MLPIKERVMREGYEEKAGEIKKRMPIFVRKT